MPEIPFIHLRLHSEYSITDGIVRLNDAVARAASYGMPALALTDLSNLFGLVKFYYTARSKGIKPLLGSDVCIANETDPDRPSRLLLLCRSRQGYLQLCELLSRAYLAPRVRGRAEITRRMLQEVGVDGLIALSGAAAGDVGEALLQGNREQAASRARRWEELFRGAFYLEVQRYGQAQQDVLVAATADLAAELELPLVATHPIQFLERDDFKAHEARVCIAEGYMLGDARRPRLYTEEQYFKSAAEMVELFADLPDALANAVEIAKRCNLQITLGKSYLPDFPTPPGVTLDDFLRREAVAGLEVRLQQLFPDPAERAAQRPAYDARLQLETDTVVQMGFPGYFLIVADFINWAKHNGCPVGPGRGSGAGSVVAYASGYYRSRPAALRPALRALPESRAGFDARLRHRLLPGQSLAGDRVRAPEVRGGGRVADRHLRHHVVEGGHSRRRARARPAVQLLRPVVQADSGRDQQAAVAGQGDCRRAATESAASKTRKKSGICSTWRRVSKI
jgi:DNA polymerase-3 subunit alpha